MIAASGLCAAAVTGGDDPRLVERLKALSCVETATAMGAVVHVAGGDAAALSDALDGLKTAGGIGDWRSEAPIWKMPSPFDGGQPRQLRGGRAMTLSERFSLTRLTAMIFKEFVQIRRDRMIFGMMVGIPLLQLLLFGFAINSDPKHPPTAVCDADHGPVARAVVAAMRASGYFRVTLLTKTEAEVDDILATGAAQFVVTVPVDFSYRVLCGERPQLLVEADATDPAATANTLSVLERLSSAAADRELTGPSASLKRGPPPFDLVVHRRHNPEGETVFNVVPGLMGWC